MHPHTDLHITLANRCVSYNIKDVSSPELLCPLNVLNQTDALMKFFLNLFFFLFIASLTGMAPFIELHHSLFLDWNLKAHMFAN